MPVRRAAQVGPEDDGFANGENRPDVRVPMRREKLDREALASKKCLACRRPSGPSIGLTWGWLRMAIYRLLQKAPVGPEEIAVLTEAYEATLKRLRLVDRSDPITQLIAKKIIEIGQRGIRDPEQISALATKELGVE